MYIYILLIINLKYYFNLFYIRLFYHMTVNNIYIYIYIYIYIFIYLLPS